MLSTLHHSISHMSHWWEFWKTEERPSFRFQILTIDGQIRFYFSTPRAYSAFLISQLYAHYPDIEVNECVIPIEPTLMIRYRSLHLHHHDLDTIKLYVNMKDRTEKDSVDPLSSLTSALVKIPKSEVGGFIIDFEPVHDHLWRTESKKSLLTSKYIPNFLKLPLLSIWGYIAWIFLPFRFFSMLFSFLLPDVENHEDPGTHTTKSHEKEITTKTDTYGFRTAIHIFKSLSDPIHDDLILKELGSSMNIFADPKGNHFIVKKHRDIAYGNLRRSLGKTTQILNTTELAGIVHLPTLYVKTPGVYWVTTRKFEPPHDLPNAENPNTPIGVANFRGDNSGFGIRPIDRARHVYIIGKTGMGKSTLLENMIYTDILNGRGVAVIDPHGDLAETILANIPKSRTNDIVLFDPADQDYPIAFNMLENNRPELRPIVAGGLVSIFKKMFAESWGPRLEYILRNTILTLLLIPETTMISIPMMLTHEAYRKKIVAKIDDPILIQFWTQEFEKMSPSMMSEAVSPILNKVGQFLSSPILRNILGQPKNPFSLRWIMDNGKIFIVNLSK